MQLYSDNVRTLRDHLGPIDEDLVRLIGQRCDPHVWDRLFGKSCAEAFRVGWNHGLNNTGYGLYTDHPRGKLLEVNVEKVDTEKDGELGQIDERLALTIAGAILASGAPCDRPLDQWAAEQVLKSQALWFEAKRLQDELRRRERACAQEVTT